MPRFLDHGRYRLSRRAVLGGALAAAAAYSGGAVLARTAAQTASGNPGTWRTWLLTSGAELRPAAPPEPSRREVDELLRLQAERTAQASELVERWGRGPAVLPWTNLALDVVKEHRPSPVRAARALALLHVALYDAVVATWDARAAHPRSAPFVAESAIVPLGDAAPDRSFPSEHAAVAGAAAIVLAYLFPEASAGRLGRLADEAATSRLRAGVGYRSDIEAGFDIGRRVGVRAIARGEADGSDAAWDGSGRLTGEGSWQPTPPDFVQQPLDPLAGTWRPWVVASGDQYRPGSPPPHRSPAWRAELSATQEAVARRTPEQEEAARFWAGSPGTVTPGGLWLEIARDLVLRDGLDGARAARVLALTAVAIADGFVCCWDAKYAYWTARPVTADPALAVLIPTPPFPSYTSGHSTISAAAATVLGHLFPADEAGLRQRAAEARDSRLWAGIHVPLDNEVGATMGGVVGRLVADYARADGAE